jgi:HK97 family phage prohead protease
MPFKPKEREYRAFISMSAIENDAAAPAYQVKGRAVVFNQPTCLFENDGVKYYEIIDRNAFAGADLTDVIMNYNHSGKVVARLKNNTLTLIITDDGLDIIADLSGTEEGRRLYEEIRGGYIDKMSFAFTVVEPDGEEYDPDTHTRTVLRIKKLYDVSAVDIPAYEQTSLSARKSFEAEHTKEIERLEYERRRKLLIAETLI